MVCVFSARNIWAVRRTSTQRSGWIWLWFLKKWLCVPWLAALVVSHSACQSHISGFRQEPRPGTTPSVRPGGCFDSISCELSLALLLKGPDCTGQLWKQCINYTRGAVACCLKSARAYETGSGGGIGTEQRSSQPGKKNVKRRAEGDRKWAEYFRRGAWASPPPRPDIFFLYTSLNTTET